MNTDTKDKRKQKVYCLILDNQVLGVWTNLKKLTFELNEKTVFVSYGKLSKDVLKLRNEGIEEGSLIFTTKDKKTYTIQVEILR